MYVNTLFFYEMVSEFKFNITINLTLLSQFSELIDQELCGVFIAYNLLRRQMKFIAEHAKGNPLRISFYIASMSIINILRYTPLESARNLPKHLAQLFEQSKIFILPEKRQRQCPRIVKIKAKKYQSIS